MIDSVCSWVTTTDSDRWVWGRHDRGGVRREAVTQSGLGGDRWLHRLAAKTCLATGSGLPHASRDGQFGAEVDRWAILNPAD